MFKIRPNVIADIYAAIEEIVFMSELNGVRASVTLLDDGLIDTRTHGANTGIFWPFSESF